jgi:hypothetical protein
MSVNAVNPVQKQKHSARELLYRAAIVSAKEMCFGERRGGSASPPNAPKAVSSGAEIKTFGTTVFVRKSGTFERSKVAQRGREQVVAAKPIKAGRRAT